VIDGGCRSNIILDVYNIEGYVEVKGFTFRNASGYINQLPMVGISIFKSKNVKIFNNVIENCTWGLEVTNCTNIEVGYNVVKNCGYGMRVSTTADLLIYAKTVTHNKVGVVVLSTAGRNVLCRNNFIENEKNADVKGAPKWDNGAEGNYWSDYKGEDKNGDGIGDSDIPHLGLDYKPLVEPWSLRRFFKVSDYTVEIVSNTTIASFFFNQTSKKISFNSTGPTLAHGFCNVTIPKALIHGNFTVLLGENPIDFVKLENATHNFLHFNYTFSSTKKIFITVTEPTTPSPPEQEPTPKPSPPGPSPSFLQLEIIILLGALLIIILLLVKKARKRDHRNFI
jgi:hypothetical protein